MSQIVVNGASIVCSLAVPAPAALVVLPIGMVDSGGKPIATVMDNKPIVNIPSFGACMSLDNPTVKAATASALGVLTPMPCLPIIPKPWSPGSSTVSVGNKAALTSDSTCKCQWKGDISILPGPPTIATG